MRRTLAALAATTALGCAGQKFTYDGQQIPTNFPLDGERWWEYAQCAQDIEGGKDPAPPQFYDEGGCGGDAATWVMRVDKTGAVTTDGTEVVTLAYSRVVPGADTGGGDDYEPLYSIDWSSDTRDGVQVHGWTDAAGNVTTFDTPVVFGEHKMNAGDSVVTETNGATYTATFVEIREQCPNYWASPWEQCLRIVVESDGADAPFLGDWWIGASWGPAAFKAAGESSVWVLDAANFGAE